jgi:hypothetical protein
MPRRIVAGISVAAVSVAVATTSMLIGVAPAHANSPCEVYDPLFDEYEYYGDGTSLDVEGLGSIVCHEGEWVGPAVDSPGGGGPVLA